MPAHSPEEIHRLIARAVRHNCPPWLAADADDIAQTATLKVLSRLERREGDEPLAASYLWRTAHSELIDEIRRRRSRREEGMGEDRLSAISDAHNPGPERRLAGHELGDAIRACLRRLIDSRRNAVTLHLMGHTLPEIGKLLGWPRKRADNLVYRGMANLRDCLREKGYEHAP